MNILLIFFALPIATIIISIALQKILRCPILVAAIIFAIFLPILNDVNILYQKRVRLNIKKIFYL